MRHLGYNALVGAQLVVARGPHATQPSRLVRRAVWVEGEISPLNGTNCTPVQSPCATRKVGAVKVRRDVEGDSGGPAPLFVNLVVRTKQKRVEREHGARLRFRGGRLEVGRYSLAVELGLDQRHRADHRVEERLELACRRRRSRFPAAVIE